MDPSRKTEVREGLLAYLRESLGSPDLEYAEAPERLFGGCQTFVYAFRLRNARHPWTTPLVARILRGRADAIDVRLEAAIQDGLIEQGFPVPCVLAHAQDPARLGGAFQIMERLPGRPLVLDGFDPDEMPAAANAARLRGLGEVVMGDWPARLARIQARLHGLDPEPLLRGVEAAGFSRQRIGLEARLDELASKARALGLEGLEPALAWLRDSRLHRDPSERAICHGDFFPNQVIEHEGSLAVIDWSDTTVGSPELDVGIVKAGLETIPTPFPGPLARAGQWVARRLAERFVTAYLAIRPLDPARVRFGEALRCVRCLVAVAERRLALAGVIPSLPRPCPYDHPMGVERLCAHLAHVTRATLATDCVIPALAGAAM